MESGSYFTPAEMEAKLTRLRKAGSIPAWLSDAVELIAGYAESFPYRETDEDSYVVEFIYPH